MSASQQEPGPAPLIGVGMVLGKCEILRELGRGGMGTVYLAHHKTLDVQVAVKVLSADVARVSPQAAERFLREARLTARIRHPNLVGVMDTDTDPATGCSFLVMEYVDGPSASALISRGPMEPRAAVRIVMGVSRALDAALQHKVVHRDVKPANILVAADGTVKLTDLGLAKDLDFQGQLTASSATLGTPLYMSPEQVRRVAVDIRTDIYSLGVTLFEMLAGRPPFNGSSFFDIAERITMSEVPDPRDWRDDVDPQLAAIVMRMMAKLPDQRYATPHDVTRALGAWLGEPIAESSAVHVPGVTGPHRALPPGASGAPGRSSLRPAGGQQRVITLRADADSGSGPPAAPDRPDSPSAGSGSQALMIAVALAVVAVAALLIVRPELFRMPAAPAGPSTMEPVRSSGRPPPAAPDPR